MEDNTEITVEEELEDLLYELFELDFKELDAVKEIEADVFSLLQKNSGNICALIVLMFMEIMRGNRYKAQSYANKIWEIGGQLPPFFEMIYIENLLNLGLIDMAMVLLKPRFEQLSVHVHDFYSVLLKFAIMTGNCSLLRRIEGFVDAEEIFVFADKIASTGRGDVFKNIQKIILESMNEKFCCYEYSLDDEQADSLGVILYTNADEQYCSSLQQQVSQKINAYLLSANEKSPSLVELSIRNIAEHEAWLPDDEG